MRRPTLSATALALGSILATTTDAPAQHHAAPHVSAPHVSMPHVAQPPHMQVPHMMQPQFFYMPPRPQPRPHANAIHPNHANASANAAAVHPNTAAAHPARANTTANAHTNAAKPAHPHAAGAGGTATANARAHANPASTAHNGAGAAAGASSSIAPGMTPQNTMHFPANNVLNFPANNVLHFPSQVSVVNTGLPTLNFPSQASIFPFPTMSGALGGSMHFPSFVTNLGGAAVVPGTLSRSTSIPAAMLATPVGVGGMVHGFHTHYWGRRIPYYGSYRNYTNSNAAQQHMNRLIADLDALQPGFSTTSYHHNRLQGDIMAVSLNYRRPSSTLVHGLARSLAQGMTRRQSPTIDTAQLAQGLRIVVNGGHLPPAEVNQAIMQSQFLLQQGGFAPADAKAVVAGMHAVVGQAQLGPGVGSGMIR